MKDNQHALRDVGNKSLIEGIWPAVSDNVLHDSLCENNGLYRHHLRDIFICSILLPSLSRADAIADKIIHRLKFIHNSLLGVRTVLVLSSTTRQR